MKKIVFCIFVTMILFCVSSCKNNQSKSEKINEFQSSLTESDTLEMLKVADDCMELLKAGKVNDALAMLYEYDDSTQQVSPLSDQTIKRYEKMFTWFPVVEYQRIYFSFQLEGLNDVKYKVKFAEEENPEENGEAVTSYMFNPVKIAGVWYLTVKRADQDIDMNRQ